MLGWGVVGEYLAGGCSVKNRVDVVEYIVCGGGVVLTAARTFDFGEAADAECLAQLVCIVGTSQRVDDG